MFVHGNVSHVALVGAKHADCADVRGCFDEYDIAWVTEDPNNEVNGLLGSHRHDDVVCVRVNTGWGHYIENLLPQPR